jgi:hypothetical protein
VRGRERRDVDHDAAGEGLQLGHDGRELRGGQAARRLAGVAMSRYFFSSSTGS